MLRPSKIGITSRHRPSALELALRGSSLRENTNPENGRHQWCQGFLAKPLWRPLMVSVLTPGKANLPVSLRHVLGITV